MAYKMPCSLDSTSCFHLFGTNAEGIDHISVTSQFLRLQHFYYKPGNCLFDALVVLLHFRYASLEIREGVVNPFRSLLEARDATY